MRAPDHGVQFPLTDGRRSTQQASVDVLAVATADVDPALAAAISGEREWRKHYPRHLRALTARAAASGEAASTIARAGLDRLHATFEVVDEDGGSRPLDETVAGEPDIELGTREVAGEGERVTELVVPYRGRGLRGVAIVEQARDWADRGVVEPSFVAAIARVVEHPEWLDLSGWAFGLLGAGAEMGPTEHLLSWGADVAAIDVPSPRVWDRLEGLARAGAGRLLVPTRPDGTDGVDLVTETAAARVWLAARTSANGPFVIGNYAYADGADFVRVAMAADTVILTLQRERDDLALAYLATPTDVFAAPPEAVAMSRERQRESGRLVGVANRLTGGRGFVPNYRLTVADEAGRELGIADSLVVQQGPNYALAKRLQRWRALVAHQDGLLSSVHVAPPTRTRSVTKNRILDAAYAGAHVFEVEPFEPPTSRAIMAALLVHDLRHHAHPEGVAGGAGDSEHDLTAAAAHGGLWRIAWEPRSALPFAVAVGARRLVGV